MYVTIPYNSFMWSLGTTSFRTKEFNSKIEKQLALLDEFWKIPENADQGWEKKYKANGQKDIYEIKNRYYDFMKEKDFITGDDKIKYKAAREKTAGLVDIGLINENHRLTEVGYALLSIAQNNDYSPDNLLSIPKDSFIYFKQLLKTSTKFGRNYVRPFVVILYLLSRLEYLSIDEFTYLAPLCITSEITEVILQNILEMRAGRKKLDDIIIEVLLSKDNYKTAHDLFLAEPVSTDLLCTIGLNRKSREYDLPYYDLYCLLYKLFVTHDNTCVGALYDQTKKVNIGGLWRGFLFNTSSRKALCAHPEKHINPIPFLTATNEAEFKDAFFKTMHLLKAKSTLSDYFDLNRRYLKISNVILFDASQIKADIVPKHFLKFVIGDLYSDAYKFCNLLEKDCNLLDINSKLIFDEAAVIGSINTELGTSLTRIEEVYREVEKIKYKRFNDLIDSKFDDKKLTLLLQQFEDRTDGEITTYITDNADVPTLFEYVLGIIWYKISGRKGKILEYMKLSLDADLLPVTHATGYDSDIVYEYSSTKTYPAHCVLLEVTLADKTNQRRMEMEPVSRHVGNHILRTRNRNSYGVFVTTFLHINVKSDFRSRRAYYYYDPTDVSNFINGMKIIPIDTKDIANIISKKLQYKDLYTRFDVAYKSAEENPILWYENFVKIK